MNAINKLSKSQSMACDSIITNISDGMKVQALSGEGGTGKTHCLNYLFRNLIESKNSVVVSATTNKAVEVINSKEIDMDSKYSVLNVKTTFRAVYDIDWFPEGKMMFDYQCDMNDHLNNYGVKPDIPSKPGFMNQDQFDTYIHCVDNNCSYESSMKRAGIAPYWKGKIVRGWKLKVPVNSILIIDEASMLTVKQLDDALKVYRSIILVGDNMQLPPVEIGEKLSFKTVWDDIHTEELTEQHRNDSGVLDYARYIRNGGNPWLYDYKCNDSVYIEKADLQELMQCAPNGSIFLAYRNKIVDLANTYKSKGMVKGEIVYCNSRPFKGKVGVLTAPNKVLFDKKKTSYACHLKGSSGMPIGYEVVPGYALTVHKAQGSEWDYIIIDLESYKFAEWIALNNKDNPATAEQAELNQRRWLYTAATRAKKGLLLLDY